MEEMENCQVQFDTDAISKLGRKELVAYVTLIRQINGSSGVCKNLISNFDYKKALILNDDENETKLSVSENKVSVSDNDTGGGAESKIFGASKIFFFKFQYLASQFQRSDGNSHFYYKV